MSENSPDIDVLLGKANELVSAGDLGAAFTAFQDVLRIDPGHAVALNVMGQMLVDSGQLDEAIIVFGRAVEAHPDEFEPRATLCKLLYKQRRGTECLAHIDKLVEMDPETPDWYSVACYLHHALGQLDRVQHYMELGTRNARRGIDFQSASRHQLPPAFTLATGEKKRTALTRRLATDKPAARQWAPDVPPADADRGGIRLRGATAGFGDGGAVRFDIAPDGEGGDGACIEAGADGTGSADGPITVWSAEAQGLTPGGTYVARMTATGRDGDLDGGEVRFTVPAATPPEAETTGADIIGTGGAVLYGAAGGSNLATRTRFRWGLKADTLDRETPAKPLPPARTLRVRDIPGDTLKQWMVYSLYTDLAAIDGSEDRYGNAYSRLRMKAPYGKDRNHLSGVGVAELIAGWDMTAEPAEAITGSYAGGTIDLRDAEVTLTLAGEALDAKDYLFALWVQSYVGRKTSEVSDEGSSPWGLTGQLVDPERFGAAANYTFTLTSAPGQWTYAGTNPVEQPHSGRYVYHPIGDVLGRHRGNLVIILLFGNERELPDGILDLHVASVRCRNGSLLAPGTDARLVQWPEDTLSDPGALTQGWIGSPDHFWISRRDPEDAQEFVWELAPDVTLQSLRLRQNPLFPAKDVEVLAAPKGGDFETVWQTTLPARADDEANAIQATAFTLLDAARPARRLKLRILSGHRPDHWGLDAVEAFGTGPEPRPETAATTLAEDIDGLEPGTTIYYRLIAENEMGAAEGEVLAVTLPESEAPVIRGADVFRHRPGRTTVLVRLSAKGRATTIRATGKDGAGNALEAEAKDAGAEATERHITLDVNVTPGSDCEISITAENDAGAAEPVTLSWHAPE